MEPQEKKSAKIAPEAYREILQGLNLESLFLASSKCSVDRKEFAPGVKVSIRDEASFEKDGEKSVVITQKFRLDAANTKLRKKVFTLECAYCLVYSFQSEFTADFFEVFKEINLPLNTWPFFRELVFNTTSRMNIPPLTLPLLKR